MLDQLDRHSVVQGLKSLVAIISTFFFKLFLFSIGILSGYRAIFGELDGKWSFGLLLVSFAILYYLIEGSLPEFIKSPTELFSRELAATWEKIQEWRQPSSTSERFKRVCTLAGAESSYTETLLRDIGTSSENRNPFDELAYFLDVAHKYEELTPLEIAIKECDIGISTSQFVQTVPDTEMRVVEFQQNSLYIRSDDRGRLLKRGMRFIVYVKQDDEDHDLLAVANVDRNLGQTTKLDIMRWVTSTSREDVREIKDGDLDSKSVYADILNRDDVMNMDIDELTEAKERLQQLESQVGEVPE